MADTSLRARLGRLFSTNVIVRRISKNRLKEPGYLNLKIQKLMSKHKYFLNQPKEVCLK